MRMATSGWTGQFTHRRARLAGGINNARPDQVPWAVLADAWAVLALTTPALRVFTSNVQRGPAQRAEPYEGAHGDGRRISCASAGPFGLSGVKTIQPRAGVSASSVRSMARS